MTWHRVARQLLDADKLVTRSSSAPLEWIPEEEAQRSPGLPPTSLPSGGAPVPYRQSAARLKLRNGSKNEMALAQAKIPHSRAS